MRKYIRFLLLIILVVFHSSSGYAAEWVRTFDGSPAYAGLGGTITLNDWGYSGPQGRQADSFDPYGGVFGNGMYDSMGAEYCIADPVACGIGQMQHVITSGPDGITPDAPRLILDDFSPNTGDFENANVDSLTTFYYWGFTSVAGSTFSNMLIDFNGNYRIAQNDMNFMWYNTIDYKQVIPDGGTRLGSTPDGNYYNSLGFQPYAVSDAIGWCGSVSTSHPNSLEPMAGQVKFGLIMDVYIRSADGSLYYFSSEYTPDFEMRSFGDVEVNVQRGTEAAQYMTARAVVNNTNPSDPIYYDDKSTPEVEPPPIIDSNMPVDAAYHNKVSFMGADALPNYDWCGIESADWVAGMKGIGVKRYDTVRQDITNQTDCEALSNGVWEHNSFAAYSYILRADAGRYVDYFDVSYGPDPMATDTDSDGVFDGLDNCTLVSNAGQQDSDGDKYGNACDADFNDDNSVNSFDIGLFKQMFLTTGDVEADLNGDNIVNSLDIGLFKTLFFQPPGPSGTTY